ncbi:hypothetical protein OV203_22735 [Nannocystis sp. ILAH1]|uniref:hypothetical protein n=1 Tax=Nannocystis sp. ILAH1 TaxID=2996789 RepID=UPI00226EB316|nr:hypothetical protein [Nannocystis sp. ILAH1]MCY0989973.1 hypothetical protein [Nannocystis sp. ILAH1]
MAETATSGELRDIRDVAEVLRQARERGEPASILIGAGASVTAGIPLATGFVDEVRRRFPNGYERAVEKTYPHVMREINDGERHELISHYVRAARLNWAHVLLGWLVREGFVGRILTTNFDNLAVRCTALYELYPAVYDVTALESFDASLVRDPAVFFLHGQHSGFVQLHTRDEVEENARRLHPVFAEATVRRPWIVLGYSGDNDPVFECLTAVRRFHYGLYWVGYRDNPPNPDVQARLLDRRRQAYWVRGHDADGFMIKLFRELGLEMPPLFADPFSHGLSLLEKLAPFPTGIHEGEVDFTAAARSHLAAAKRWFLDGHPPEADERHHEQVLVTLQGYFLRGDFDRIIAYANDTPPAKLVPVITAALATRASATAEGVRDALRLGGPFEGLLTRVIEDLDRVLVLSPEFAEAYCDRASARLMAAEVTRGEAEFDALVERARSDLHEALQREPGMYEALHNLAYCDALEAARHQGAARAAHLQRAVAGYRRALESTREGLLTHVFLARAAM